MNTAGRGTPNGHPYPLLDGLSWAATQQLAHRTDNLQAALKAAEHHGVQHLSLHPVDWQLVRQHEAALTAGGVVNLIQTLQQALPDVLSLTEIAANYATFPELATLRHIASHGAHPFTHPTFVANQGMAGRIRPHVPRAAVLTKAVELQSSGRGFLVRRHVLRHVTQRVHVSEVFVIPKDNNPLGRCVFDFTNADGGGLGPNHPDLREKWRDACGRIILPGLDDVCDVVVQAINTHGDKAVAGTADISGAFNHILDSPEGTLLHAVCVATEDDPDNDLILFTVVTMFGSTGGPYTWGVVSRALSWRAEARITTTVMYSDDKLCAGGCAWTTAP